MDIHLAGSRPTRRAPKENFTGTVLQDPIITQQAPARLVANRVAFEPGARTAWHSHPLGQTQPFGLRLAVVRRRDPRRLQQFAQQSLRLLRFTELFEELRVPQPCFGARIGARDGGVLPFRLLKIAGRLQAACIQQPDFRRFEAAVVLAQPGE